MLRLTLACGQFIPREWMLVDAYTKVMLFCGLIAPYLRCFVHTYARMSACRLRKATILGCTSCTNSSSLRTPRARRTLAPSACPDPATRHQPISLTLTLPHTTRPRHHAITLTLACTATTPGFDMHCIPVDKCCVGTTADNRKAPTRR